MITEKKNKHEQTTSQAAEDLENSRLNEENLDTVVGGRKQTPKDDPGDLHLKLPGEERYNKLLRGPKIGTQM